MDGAELLTSPRFVWNDEHQDYGEERRVTIGVIAGWMCVCAYTLRGSRDRIISLRKANACEQARYGKPPQSITIAEFCVSMKQNNIQACPTSVW